MSLCNTTGLTSTLSSSNTIGPSRSKKLAIPFTQTEIEDNTCGIYSQAARSIIELHEHLDNIHIIVGLVISTIVGVAVL